MNKDKQQTDSWTSFERLKSLIDFVVAILVLAPVVIAMFKLAQQGLNAIVPAWFALLATTCALFIGYLLGKKARTATVNTSSSHGVITRIILVMVFGFLVAGIWLWNAGNVFFHDDAVEVKITNPRENDVVETEQIVKGSCKNIETDQMIWIVIYSNVDNMFYPHSSSAIINDRNNMWISQGIVIGADSDAGKKFRIIALLADSTLQRQFSEYLEFPARSGLEKLPENARVYHQITVTRK